MAAARKTRLKPLHYVATTDANGDASISIQVPGVYREGNPFENSLVDGRFLRTFEIWCPDGSDGDLLYDIRIEDTDNVLVGDGKPFSSIAQASVFYPHYPIILYAQDDEIIETANLLKGFAIPVGEIIRVQTIEYEFIPSGLYLKAEFLQGGALQSKKVRMNVFWGQLQ